MAYLLTEIALEMLGCKFYDINGREQDMNDFQNEQYSDIKYDDENNLKTILQFDDKSVLIKNIKVNKKEEHESLKEECDEPIEEITSKPLVKLMEEEYNNVRNQILLNKKTILSKRIAAHTPEEVLEARTQHFFNKEIVKLRWEAQTIRNFRRFVERTVMATNPAAFEKYCKTFAKDVPPNH